MKQGHVRSFIGLACLVAFFVAVVLPFVYQTSATVPASVWFIHVGQGDAALLQTGSGFEVLIDGGPPAAGPTVVAFLRSRNVDSVEVMVASHAHEDHIGGLIDVLEASDIEVQQVLCNGYPGDTSTWQAFATAVATQGIPLVAAQFPQTYIWDDFTVYVLNPDSGLTNPDQNDASIVLLLRHQDIDFLFPGDIPSQVEATVVARGTPVASEILKVAHHGSRCSSSEEFLAAVHPAEAIISVGPNPYGHPHLETLARLQAVGARIWRTDQNGTIWVVSDGSGYTITAETTPTPRVVYLPLLRRDRHPTPTPTPTATRTPTPAPTATPAPTGFINITYIFFDGSGSNEPDEYVEIRNDDDHAIQLQGWTLRDQANHVFTFPSYVMLPGQVCRVYTNEWHPEWCNFNYQHGWAIWNNDGDCAYLSDASFTLVDTYCY